MDKVGYMGIPGSFSEIAAEELLKQEGLEGAELDSIGLREKYSECFA